MKDKKSTKSKESSFQKYLKSRELKHKRINNTVKTFR